MAASFKVQGELVLVEGGFVGNANAAKAALEGVSTAGRKVVETSAAVAAATNQASQAQAAATVSAKSQADGFARLAQQQATDVARAQSKALMASVEQSGPQLQALYGAATKAQAAELGKATAAVGAHKTAQESLRSANDNTAASVDKASRAVAYQRTQLSFQLNDIFTQLASGQGVVRTAVQQGPQITQLYGGIGNALRAVPLAAAGYAAAIGAVIAITASAVVQLNEFNARNRQAEISLQATGRAANVTASQLELVVQAEARRPGADRQETQQAALQLLSNSQISGAAVQRTLALARDLARVTGTDLPTAASALSSGLDGTLAGAKKLDAAFNALTPAELEQIRRFEELGQRGAAVGVVLTALERNLGGANDKGVTPLTKAATGLRTSWNSLLDSLSKTGVINVAANAITALAAPLTLAAKAADLLSKAGSAPSSGLTSEDIAGARASLEFARQQLAEAQKNQAQNPGDYQFENAVNVARRNVAELQANVAQLESKAGVVTARALQDQVTAEATALKKETNEAIALLDRSVTVAAQRRVLEGERAQIEKATRSGLLDPDTLGRAQERLTQIDGQLKGLRTPAEEMKRGLDLESTLAKLPPHLQAAERAFLETKRRAIEQGATLEQAQAAADQARANVLQTQATATGQQIQLLSAEADAALRVAAAYGTSRVQALQLAAELKAQAAEQQGSIAGGTAGEFAQRQLEEDAATAVATSAAKNEAYSREVAGLERLVEAEGRSSVAARETERANKVATYAEDLRAQAAATNNATIIAAAERQIQTYDRLTRAATAAEIRRDANALNRQHDPQVAYDQELAKLQELQATGLLTRRTIEESTRESELRRLEASRDATDGMIAGLRRYADAAADAGQAAADGVASGLRTIEDTLVQVTTTGKFTFSEFANSVIADIARIAIRQNITGPIAKAVGGLDFGNILGGIFGASATAPQYNVGNSIVPGIYHGGGIVSDKPTVTRSLPAELWRNAPRFHTGRVPGLAANERAVVVEDDEEILTSRNPRHRWNIGRAGNGGSSDGPPQIEFKLINNGEPMGQPRRGGTSQNSNGDWQMEIILDRLDEGLGSRIADGRGHTAGAIASTFGFNRQGRR